MSIVITSFNIDWVVKRTGSLNHQYRTNYHTIKKLLMNITNWDSVMAVSDGGKSIVKFDGGVKTAAASRSLNC
jgi:hypothetical protein